MVKKLFIKLKEDFINEEVKNDIIYPMYAMIYSKIFPYYFTFIMLLIIIIILLIVLMYMIYNSSQKIN